MKKIFKPALALIIALLYCNAAIAQLQGQVLLNVNYENGTITSGVQGIEGTGIENPPADAAYMVTPGATSNYAVAHKIIGGNAAYFSDGNTRSESSALENLGSRFYSGDINRYEFSILLKDWASYTTDATETNLFQLKMSGGITVPYMFRIVRDKIRIRYGGVDGLENSIYDYVSIMPHVNQWMHFRVDVVWSTTNTGSFTTYAKLPGDTEYQLVDKKENYRTFTGDPSTNVGYIKWGLYVAPNGVTRVAYHDDIRIINLRAPYTSTGLIWGNGISEANPAYLDGPYTKEPNIYNRDFYTIANNKRDAYLHPYLKFIPSQGIQYAVVTAPNTVDNVTGTPYSDFSRTTLQPAGNIDANTPGPNGRYLLSGWTNGSVATPSTLNPNQYFEFKLEPSSGNTINFSQVVFNAFKGGATTNPNTFALRSSADNFVNNIDVPKTITATGSTPTEIIFDASNLVDITTAITFRLYAYGATANATQNAGIFDFAFYGQVVPSTLPTETRDFSAILSGGNILVNWTTLSETNNSHFEIELSKDGKNFTSVQTIKSKNGNSKTTQNYQANIAIASLTSLFAIPLLFGLHNRRKNRKLAYVLLSSVCICLIISCKKNTETSDSSAWYVRIKQVDLDGNTSLSDTIYVVDRK